MIKMSITDQLMEISKKKVDGNSLIDVDSKTKGLYYHFVTLMSTVGYVYVTYISDYADKYTFDTLKAALANNTLICNGYLDSSVAQYISGERGGLSVGVIDLSDGSTEARTIDNTFSVYDEVTPV